jgi:hypothetical protein
MNLAQLCKSPRDLALAMHRNAGWLEHACTPVPIFPARDYDLQSKFDHTGAISENESRLRGLMWNLITLQKCYAEDPSDAECAEAIAADKALLLRAWRIAVVPDSLQLRTELAASAVWLRAGASEPRREPQQRELAT